jgi:hypothetical protein
VHVRTLLTIVLCTFGQVARDGYRDGYVSVWDSRTLEEVRHTTGCRLRHCPSHITTAFPLRIIPFYFLNLLHWCRCACASFSHLMLHDFTEVLLVTVSAAIWFLVTCVFTMR